MWVSFANSLVKVIDGFHLDGGKQSCHVRPQGRSRSLAEPKGKPNDEINTRPVQPIYLDKTRGRLYLLPDLPVAPLEVLTLGNQFEKLNLSFQ